MGVCSASGDNRLQHDGSEFPTLGQRTWERWLLLQPIVKLMLRLRAVVGWLTTRRRTVPSANVVPTPDLVVRFAAPAVAPRRIGIESTPKRASTDDYVAEALAATSTVVPTPRRVARGSAAPLIDLVELDDDEITNILPCPFAGDTTEPSILLS